MGCSRTLLRNSAAIRLRGMCKSRRARCTTYRPQLVDKLLPRVFRVNIQPDAGDGPADGRHHHWLFRRPRQRSALQQQRHQHHEEGDIEEQAGVVGPAIIGNTARIMGTAPRRPTQLINTRSRRLKPRNGSRPANTDRGRAMNIIHIDSSSAGIAIGSRSEGVTSRPSTGTWRSAPATPSRRSSAGCRAGCGSAGCPAESRRDRRRGYRCRRGRW